MNPVRRQWLNRRQELICLQRRPPAAECNAAIATKKRPVSLRAADNLGDGNFFTHTLISRMMPNIHAGSILAYHTLAAVNAPFICRFFYSSIRARLISILCTVGIEHYLRLSRQSFGVGAPSTAEITSLKLHSRHPPRPIKTLAETC